MNLAKLLNLHHQFSPKGCLPGSWGDGFLVAHNLIYANIRTAALNAGFRFDSNPSLAYRTLPLGQLDKLLAAKQLFYQDNVSAVEELGLEVLKQLEWDQISDHLSPNRVFHESCHAVCRSSLKLRNAAETELAFDVLWEESFSNTCEMIATLYADTAAHRCFLQSNSYFFVPECRTSLQSLNQELPLPWIFVFIQLCYLDSNFLRDRLSDPDFERILKLTDCMTAAPAKPSPKVQKILRSVSKICFDLNPRFREVTTDFHFRTLGFRQDVTSLLSQDFMAQLETNLDRQKLAAQLAVAICGPRPI